MQVSDRKEVIMQQGIEDMIMCNDWRKRWSEWEGNYKKGYINRTSPLANWSFGFMSMWSDFVLISVIYSHLSIYPSDPPKWQLIVLHQTPLSTPCQWRHFFVFNAFSILRLDCYPNMGFTLKVTALNPCWFHDYMDGMMNTDWSTCILMCEP